MGLLAVGEAAPAFTLPNQDGSDVALASFSGKYVLMWWYPKADTPG
ncbi:MAG: redoxin domain-containing protein [Rhodospirillales bacterium]|jgi:thioredoxin-dependent peroxiredoxin|nr:redoxin domain-containing protein [Rhodospirillales bacterium]MBT3905252.1 redoxin domain-containing protein [Rhodospirillaceae bacterium]MBT5035871.1 redoxin domain-containing protein [Rhodospirillaceae bacterium]MBT6222156.1 redoxin domain-containing protein [Rhodospirillaceae bacterium]MBT6364350.1 redoxin domain-containing protein [Rhodospirillaceae bacterium]